MGEERRLKKILELAPRRTRKTRLSRGPYISQAMEEKDLMEGDWDDQNVWCRRRTINLRLNII